MNIVMAFLIAATVSLQTVKLGTAPGKTMVVTGATVSAHAEITNTVTKAYVESLGIEAGISAPTATNIAEGVVREGVRTNYLCTVAAAQAKADAAREQAKAAIPVHMSTSSVTNYDGTSILYGFKMTRNGHRYNMIRSVDADYGIELSCGGCVYVVNDETQETSCLIPNGSDFAHMSDLPTASSLRAVTYAADAPNDHKTAAGILSVAGRSSGTIATNVLNAADTTYRLFNCITNINQSRQFIKPNGAAVTISVPAAIPGGTRDWIIYAYPTADTPIDFSALVHARFNEDSVTNALPANKVTALYFTEIGDNIIHIGRATPEKGW